MQLAASTSLTKKKPDLVPRTPAHSRRIVGAAFANDKTFQNALNTAFEHFINLSPRAPEYISLFMDDQLRKVQGRCLFKTQFQHNKHKLHP